MSEEIKTSNFIEEFIVEDIAEGGQFEGMTVHTRFPPEPNGYLHIGHCKALCIDFGTAEKFGGKCNLRFDDTNPTKEDVEFVDAIQEDIRWLGFEWDQMLYGSDYFEKDYEFAVELIKKGLAYVCELTPEEFKEYRTDGKVHWIETPDAEQHSVTLPCDPANPAEFEAALKAELALWNRTFAYIVKADPEGGYDVEDND